MSQLEHYYPIDHITPTRVPSEIIAARKLFLGSARNKGHNVTLKFNKNSYRPVDENSGVESQRDLTFGSLDGAKAVLSYEQRRRVMTIAGWLASIGTLSMRRFDLVTESFAPVEVDVQVSPLPGFLTFLPERNLKSADGADAFTMTPWIAHACGAFASFVGCTEVDPKNDATATATEIMQNRLQVVAVTTDDGRRYTAPKMTHPYQEIVANGVGNVCGMVTTGHDFKSYNLYMRTAAFPMMRGDSDDLMLLAPHHLVTKNVYEQIAAGEVPSEAPRFLPIHPAI